MKSFLEQRQKRGASEVAKPYHGSPSKIKLNIIIVKIIQLDPYTLGAYFIKGDGGYPYYRPLIQGLEQEHEWCKNLKIGMTVRRRECGGGAGDAIKVKVKDMQLNWHIFLHFLDDDELGQSKNIGQKWGETLAGAMNYFFANSAKKIAFAIIMDRKNTSIVALLTTSKNCQIMLSRWMLLQLHRFYSRTVSKTKLLLTIRI